MAPSPCVQFLVVLPWRWPRSAPLRQELLMAIDQVQINRDKWLDFWKYYEEETAQTKGVLTLYDHINQADPTLLAENAAWMEEYRNKVGSEAAPLPGDGFTNPLKVPFDCQLTNPGGEGWRECFSSSCDMTAMYWGVIDHQNEYHKVRPKFGDSTDPSAQIRTLGTSASRLATSRWAASRSSKLRSTEVGQRQWVFFTMA